MTTKRLIDVLTAAEMLGVCRTSVYNLMDSGELGSINIGARRLIPVAAIDEFIAARLEAA